ncbi:hypothetical protein T459_28046 [Capsicum annuum]|uniref:Uncharacterized protein n=1 Tax=Capsicum annuum TaxID=4072 RepID=A0A2G2YFS1_CAPAN|nr:hypothetical protein T459_28046 [Capsicum annuum]
MDLVPVAGGGGRYSVDLVEVMSTIMVLTLRSPHNAACAVEAGAGDIVIRAMQRFPESELLQRSCCFMIRNLVVRNPENRQVSTGLHILSPQYNQAIVENNVVHSANAGCQTILLGNGIEKLIRKAKMNCKSCKNAAADALRDLGLDNFDL